MQPLRTVLPRLLPKAGWALGSWVGPSFHVSHVLEAELGGGKLEQIKNSICVILFSQEERTGVGRQRPPPPPAPVKRYLVLFPEIRLSSVSLRGLS